jgi:hypothetical protein
MDAAMIIGSRRHLSDVCALLGISEDPIDAGDANIQAASNLGSLHAFAIQFQNLSSLCPRCGLSTFVFPVLFGFGNPFALTFQKQTTLEFSYCAEHGDHQLAGWRTSVDALTSHREHDQADASTIKVFHDPQKVSGASSKTIGLGDDQRISTPHEPQSLLEAITLSDG